MKNEANIYLHPLLKHDKLTSAEMAMICDVCNPGFKLSRITWDNNPEQLAVSLRMNVEDSFRLYPGAFERKWDVNREALIRKLWEMTPGELAKVADQVDEFWKDGNVHGLATDFPNGVK